MRSIGLFGFGKSFRLLKPGQFGRVFKTGKRSSDKYFSVIAARNDLGYPRLGLAISKKCAKKAVSRNRLKRLARESFRLNKDTLLDMDIVVTGRPAASEENSRVLRESLLRHFLNLNSIHAPTDSHPS